MRLLAYWGRCWGPPTYVSYPLHIARTGMAVSSRICPHFPADVFSWWSAQEATDEAEAEDEHAKQDPVGVEQTVEYRVGRTANG